MAEKMPLAPGADPIQKSWHHWSHNPDTDWYYRGPISKRRFGNLRFHVFAGAFYFGVAVGVPFIALCLKDNPRQALEWLFTHAALGALWLAFVTLSLPAFIWLERLSFDDWVSNVADRGAKRKLVARFELNTAHMETFWKTVAGLYVAGGLISLSDIGQGKSSALPSKDEVKELISKVEHLAKVTKGELPALDAATALGNGITTGAPKVLESPPGTITEEAKKSTDDATVK